MVCYATTIYAARGECAVAKRAFLAPNHEYWQTFYSEPGVLGDMPKYYSHYKNGSAPPRTVSA